MRHGISYTPSSSFFSVSCFNVLFFFYIYVQKSSLQAHNKCFFFFFVNILLSSNEPKRFPHSIGNSGNSPGSLGWNRCTKIHRFVIEFGSASVHWHFGEFSAMFAASFPAYSISSGTMAAHRDPISYSLRLSASMPAGNRNALSSYPAAVHHDPLSIESHLCC